MSSNGVEMSLGDVANWPELGSPPTKGTRRISENVMERTQCLKTESSSKRHFPLVNLIDMAKAARNIQPVKRPPPALKTTVLSGNRLDSDQPVRHKGKKRLNAPKLSQMKKAIKESRPGLKRDLSPELIDLKKRFTTRDEASLASSLSTITLVDGLTGDLLEKRTKAIVHTKKFKSYCTNLMTVDLKANCEALITTLRKFQDRLHAKDPVKAFSKRRYVCGLRETKKFVQCERVKCVLVATDLEMEEGLPSFGPLNGLLEMATASNIPVAFPARGIEMGYWTLKKRKISVIGIMNYDGANEEYQQLIVSLTDARECYAKVYQQVKERLMPVTDQESIVDLEEEIRNQILSKLKC